MDDEDRKKIIDFLEKNRNTLFWEKDIIDLTGIKKPKAIGSFLAHNTRKTLTKVERVSYKGGNRPFYGITDHGPGACFYSWCNPTEYQRRNGEDNCPKKCGGVHGLNFYGLPTK